MNKTIIAVDLDGTLLDKEGLYSIATRDYFRKLNSLGYYVVLASGRPFRAMRRIYEDLHCFAPVIAYNGAYVFHPLDPAFPVFEASFSAKDIRTIYEKTKGYVNSFMAESKDTVYIDKTDLSLARYFPYSDMRMVQAPLSESVQEATFTCLFRCDLSLQDRLKADVEQASGIAWRPWNQSVYSELYIPSAHKGTALEYLMKTLGAKKEDVYAFGDAENDVPMLQVAGHPYAMKGNRVPHILSHFPTTKNSVAEDGVKKELETTLKL